MKTEEWVALGGFISIVASSCALIIRQIEQSRCSHIRLCGKCIDCDRIIKDDEKNENQENNP